MLRGLSRRRRRTLLDIAWHRHPLRSIRFLLEIGAQDERPSQVFRILDHCDDREPRRTARQYAMVEVFGEDCVCAVRHAVLPQIAWTQPRGHHLERSGECHRWEESSTPATAETECRHPGWRRDV